MPEEWPITALAAERGAIPRRFGRGRLETVRRDFFLDESERLTEQERALMGTMLDGLVTQVRDELRAALPDGWVAANDGAPDRLFARLKETGLLDIEPLLAVLLRQAEEESAASAARSRANRREARLLQSLVSHDNGPVAAAAMSLVLARGRRRGPLGQCLVTTDDLDSATLTLLAQCIAAALRMDLASAHGAAAADEALSGAVEAVVRRHNPEASSDALSRELIALLDSAGRLDDQILLAAAGEGEVALLSHGLARRAGVAPAIAAEAMTGGEPALAMALLRMGGASRELAAGLIAVSDDLYGSDGSAIDLFDRMPASEVETIRAWMTSASGYRSALARLERGHG